MYLQVASACVPSCYMECWAVTFSGVAAVTILFLSVLSYLFTLMHRFLCLFKTLFTHFDQ